MFELYLIPPFLLSRFFSFPVISFCLSHSRKMENTWAKQKKFTSLRFLFFSILETDFGHLAAWQVCRHLSSHSNYFGDDLPREASHLPNVSFCMLKDYFQNKELMRHFCYLLFWTQTVSFVKTVSQVTCQLNLIVPGYLHYRCEVSTLSC